MKVEWLNEQYTVARLTKGWFKKYTTIVYRGCQPEVKRFAYREDRWFWPDGTFCDGTAWFTMEFLRDKMIKRKFSKSNWQPVVKLPKATVNRSNTRVS